MAALATELAQLIAEHIGRASQLPMFERWNLRRFKEGNVLSEVMIIG